MSSEFEAQLTLKDRLNFPYLLANQILTFQKAILNLEYSDREIREAIEGFVHLIPETWKDDKFSQDYENAVTDKQKDMRPIVAGQIRMSEEACRKLGIKPYVTEKTVDYYQVFQACMNLLNRRKLLSKILRIEELDSIESITEDELRQSNLPSE